MEKNGTAGSPQGSRDDPKSGRKLRACDFCFRMKMRCETTPTTGKVDPANPPPCNRCRQGRRECTFEGARKTKGTKVEDRLKVVEEQMSEMQSSLAELIKLQRAALVNPPPPANPPPIVNPLAATPSAAAPAAASPPDSVPPVVVHQAAAVNVHSQPPPIPPPPPGPSGYWKPPSSSRSPTYSPPKPTPLLSLPSGPSYGTGQTSAYEAHQTPNDTTRLWGPRVTSRESQERRSSTAPADIESGPQSEDEEDEPMAPHAVIYNNMLNLAEAARLKADGHLEQNDPLPRKRDARGNDHRLPFDYTVDDDHGPRRKSARIDNGSVKVGLPLQRGSHVHAFKNPIELGFCSAKRGKQLFEIFMNGAAHYVPIFEPTVDTWESLLKRSPFTVTVLMYVGAKIEDAGGPPSELQNMLKNHAETIGMHTLFTPVARIEVLQAMIILSSWGDTSWRPGGHALRIAMDMGLYRCLPFLLETGMGVGKTEAELQEERPLVVGARCWLALYKSECEMSFNLGRPALFAAEDTLSDCRRLLEHPLAIQTDSRLVAACELLTLRLTIHRPFSIWAPTATIPNLDERIEEANVTYSDWFKYWDQYYIHQGVAPTNYLRELLLSQYSHARLHTNSRILHSVRSRRDASLLPEKRHALLVNALRSAETLVGMALRASAYASNFAKANFYTHVGVAIAARMLIRLTSLIPEHVDIKQTGRDLESLTKRLAQVPGFQFAQQLREIIIKARRQHVLPPSSRTPSRVPSRNPSPTPDDRPRFDGYATGSTSLQLSPVIPTQLDTALGASPEGVSLDFLLAEQLFASGTHDQKQGSSPSAETSTSLVDQLFTLDSWFPYPPLESDPLYFGASPTATM